MIPFSLYHNFKLTDAVLQSMTNLFNDYDPDFFNCDGK